MKLYAPAYYPKFSCIADACEHTCCVGWEIDIDPDTAARYRTLRDGYGAHIAATVSEEGGTPHFCLGENERCPHLDEKGLCRIIKDYGEEMLCEICREHPRFYHAVTDGMEVGLGMACEEACRLILSADGYAVLPVGEWDGETAEVDMREERARVYALLSSPEQAYAERVRAIEQLCAVSPAAYADEEWREALAALEYLNADNARLFSRYTSDSLPPPSLEVAHARALAYFIYRHGSATESREEWRAAVGLSLFLTRLLATLCREMGAESVTDMVPLARTLSEELEYSEENTESLREMFLF